MHCLCCHERYVEKISWQSFFCLTTSVSICEQCSKKLELIKGDICEKCGRPFSHLEPEYRQGDLCYDCVRWGDSALEKNRSLYVYNDFLQEIIAKWKYRGDAEISKLFWGPLKNFVKPFGKIDVVIPIPLSKERLYERSFNQALVLAEGLDLPIIETLIRPQEAAKQSKKSRKERLFREERFQMEQSSLYDFKGKTVLLVDDIYTTGATLYSAANVLKANGAGAIFSITVARG